MIFTQTPLLKSYPLSQATGKNVFMKVEAMQPTGSYKLRGMSVKAAHAISEGVNTFYSSSGGNAGLAVAYAGMMYQTETKIFTPKTLPKHIEQMFHDYEADLVKVGDSWAESHSAALKDYAANPSEDKCFFHPFDDPLVWYGHSILIDEVVDEGFVPDLVVCTVGGGGLLCGIIEGLTRNQLLHVPVLGVETVGANALQACLEQNCHAMLPEITSKASSLGAPQVCEQAYKLLLAHRVAPYLVTDKDAIKAQKLFLQDHRIQVELACSAGLAALYSPKSELIAEAENILFVVCGGVCI